MKKISLKTIKTTQPETMKDISYSIQFFKTNFVLQVYRAVSDQSPQIVCYKKNLQNS